MERGKGKETIFTVTILIKMGKTHFTVAYFMIWPLSGSEDGIDFNLIETSLLFMCQSCFYGNQFALTYQKTLGLYQSKVNSSLYSNQGPGH